MIRIVSALERGVGSLGIFADIEASRYDPGFMFKYDDEDFRDRVDRLDDERDDSDPTSPKENDNPDEAYDDILEVESDASFDAATVPPPTVTAECVTASGVMCVVCGYDLTGVQIGSHCPECGTPVSRSFQSLHQPRSGMAIASLVLGIVSVTVVPVSCGCLGIPGLICGALAIAFYIQVNNDVKAGRVSPQVSGMAKAGLVCGIIGTALSLAATLLFAGFAFTA